MRADRFLICEDSVVSYALPTMFALLGAWVVVSMLANHPWYLPFAVSAALTYREIARGTALHYILMTALFGMISTLLCALVYGIPTADVRITIMGGAFLNWGIIELVRGIRKCTLQDFLALAQIMILDELVMLGGFGFTTMGPGSPFQVIRSLIPGAALILFGIIFVVFGVMHWY